MRKLSALSVGALATVILTPMAPSQAALSPAVQELVTRLAAAESLDDAAIGDGGIESETYKTYKLLRDRATQKELLELTKHAHPVVRGYAAQGLVDTNATVDWKQLMLDHLADQQKVTTFRGCVKAEQKFGDVLFEILRPKLTEDQLQDVAEAFLRNLSPLDARASMLLTLRFRDGVLHLVRDLARRGEAPAAVALARYGLAVDVPILIQHLKLQKPFDEIAQFTAAAISKDTRLLPALLAIEPAARERIEHDNCSRLRPWLAAIAAQGSEEAGAFLLKFLQTTSPDDKFKEKDLLTTYKQVLVEYPNASVFDGVRAELKQRHAARADKKE